MRVRPRKGLDVLGFRKTHGQIGTCDYCGDVVEKRTLRPYKIYAGEPITSFSDKPFGPMPALPMSTNIVDTGFLVCPSCFNHPHPNLTKVDIGGDPKPVDKPRPSANPTFYLITESGNPISTEANDNLGY